jgi:hypothetical protein
MHFHPACAVHQPRGDELVDVVVGEQVEDGRLAPDVLD